MINTGTSTQPVSGCLHAVLNLPSSFMLHEGLAWPCNSFAIPMPGTLVPNNSESLGKLFGKPGTIDISVVFWKLSDKAVEKCLCQPMARFRETGSEPRWISQLFKKVHIGPMNILREGMLLIFAQYCAIMIMDVTGTNDQTVKILDKIDNQAQMMAQ